jgi:hypothetical protein
MPNPPANEDQPWPTAAVAGRHPSIRRRQLLRAAASAGPLIATLPSGAALAQASAIHCAMSEQNAAAGNQAENVLASPYDDRRVRVAGEERIYQSDTNSREQVRVYYIPQGTVAPAAISVHADGAMIGDWFDPTGYHELKSERRHVGFLVQYETSTSRPDPTQIAVPADPRSMVSGAAVMPSQCQITNAPDWSDDLDAGAPTDRPRSPDFCFYPFTVQAPTGTAGNIPLAHSCLCSVQPNNIVACNTPLM